jgi:uncharacterized glyoxalase superfamily protein PhnB
MRTTGIALRPFVPSGSNFALTKSFLCELGFEVEWENQGLAGLRFGAGAIILQDIDVPVWQSNQMLVVDVDDLERYWSEIEAKQLEPRYAGTKLRPPTDFPWGREVHVIDPGGVCWHFRQAQTASPA